MKQGLIINSHGKAKRRRSFTLLDRAIKRAREQIMLQEDQHILAMLTSLGNKND